MTELKKHALLIMLLVILVITKFIIVPVYEWQDNQLAEINLLNKQQHKVTQLIKAQHLYVDNNIELEKSLSQVKNIFHDYETESAFKISQQKALENLLIENNVKLQNFGWEATTLLQELAVTQYPINIRINGKGENVIKLLAVLEKNEKRIEVVSFNLTFKGQKKDQLGSLEGQLTLNLFKNNEQISTRIREGV